MKFVLHSTVQAQCSHQLFPKFPIFYTLGDLPGPSRTSFSYI